MGSGVQEGKGKGTTNFFDLFFPAFPSLVPRDDHYQCSRRLVP